MQHNHDAEPVATVASDAGWQPRMRTDKAALYLAERHGLPVEEKTLRNWRAAGRGPVCRYLGTLPLYDRAELDRWVEHDALKSESPMRRNRRIANERQAAA